MIQLSLGEKALEVVGEDILKLLKHGVGFKGHNWLDLSLNDAMEHLFSIMHGLFR